MIVLVDTSVSIGFLSDRASYAAKMDVLFSRDEVSGHDFVYGELLVGDRGGRKEMLADHEQMHQARSCLTRISLHLCVLAVYMGGVSAGLMYIYLLSPRWALKLWTADSRLATVARELGIAYE